jgi:GNAT superfamily N-acetyltransferase
VAVDDDRVLGTLLLEPSDDLATAEIEAVAVRWGRRGQGLGTALVMAAVDRTDCLIAAFDESVRPFWASLGFEIEPGARPGRFVGRLENDPTA